MAEERLDPQAVGREARAGSGKRDAEACPKRSSQVKRPSWHECNNRSSAHESIQATRPDVKRSRPSTHFHSTDGLPADRRRIIFFFFFNDTATTEIYTLSLHDALPICRSGRCRRPGARP